VSNFVLATTNAHKVEEIRLVLGPLGVELLPRPDEVPEVDETATTLEGNALLKAHALSTATGEAALADDTGLFVDALNGQPGVYSARYAGPDASFADNVSKLLLELDGVEGAKRTARFRTVIAVAYPDGSSWWVEGVLEGFILTTPKGNLGFGYDPVFAPEGLNGSSLAEITSHEKGVISHRGNALRAFAARLQSS
jgi:XTP/dITP diphosphohydrolase